MKTNIKKITAVFALAICMALPATSFAQDIPVPSLKSSSMPPSVGFNDDPASAVPFGTGLDFLILLGGGALAKRFRDKRKAAR